MLLQFAFMQKILVRILIRLRLWSQNPSKGLRNAQFLDANLYIGVKGMNSRFFVPQIRSH